LFRIPLAGCKSLLMYWKSDGMCSNQCHWRFGLRFSGHR
jgi:spore cortex formation protein SpoVR/YcgB (stage V sporulation)